MQSPPQNSLISYTYKVAPPPQPDPLPPSDMYASILAVENILQYKFKNKSLLEEALTHSSYTESRNYQRLELLGDAVLGLAVSNYFYVACPEVGQGQLTLLRAANVSTEKLARVAVRMELYRYVRHNATDLDDKVRDFVRVVLEEDETEFYGGAIKAPKVLADIVESVAAAIYVDRGYNLVDLWMVFRRLLEPIVTVDVLEKHPQPVTMLFELCQKEGKKVDIKHWRKGEKNISSIFVDGEFIASSFSEHKDNAKLHAAKLALQKLSFQVSGSLNIDLGLDGNGEVQGAKQKLHEVCGKRKWPKPSFRYK
ncbi:hypothetical protein Leryth_005725, partial [Lithospermum erythrorhizon]